MLPINVTEELREKWLPNTTWSGLARVVELLEKGSPFLIHGCFSRAIPMGCLASHIAWNHPKTWHMTVDAGIFWLGKIAGLNPSTSHVLNLWDKKGVGDLATRQGLLKEFRKKLEQRPIISRNTRSGYNNLLIG